MARLLLVLLLKVVGGLVLAGMVVGILIPLLPGLVEPWMVAFVAVICVGGILFATANRTPKAPI
jgi:hypothetical protein